MCGHNPLGRFVMGRKSGGAYADPDIGNFYEVISESRYCILWVSIRLIMEKHATILGGTDKAAQAHNLAAFH